MTKTAAIVLALSLLINEVHILFDDDVLQNQHFASNLVFLLSTSLILREYVNIIPRYLWRLSPAVSFVLELILSLLLLECSLFYIWKFIQGYILLHSDDILVHLSEDRGLDWVVCHLCCGESNCSEIFAALVLKAASFCLLLAVCCYTGIK